jgi:glycosyltransferase involved in cell wall biosynthesis
LKTITVIMAAYQAQDFILEAIASVLAQQLPANYQLEFILGVDGCEDTWQAVRGLSDDRLEVHLMARNYGTYITFNTMMGFATGDLIVRFDADDIMLDGYLRKQTEEFEQQPEVCLTWTRNHYIDIHGHLIAELNNRKDNDLKFWEIRSPSNGQFMIRRKLWSTLGGFQPWPCNSDTDFLFRMRFLGYQEHGVDEVLYLRRIHPDSLTQSAKTGYDSALRKEFQAIMRREKEERRSKEECYVEPVVGVLAADRPKSTEYE